MYTSEGRLVTVQEVVLCEKGSDLVDLNHDLKHVLCFISLSKTCCVDVLLIKCKVLYYNFIAFKLVILNLHSKVNIF